MSSTPVLWGRGSSTNVQKVLWLCTDLGIAHERRIVGGPHGGLDTPEYGAMNPNRTVPVWQEGEFVLWESHAILRHLARRHGTLYGTDAGSTARIDQWLDWFATVQWPPIRNLFIETFRDGKVPYDDPLAQSWKTKAEAALAVAAGRISDQGHLAGPDVTIADIPMAIALNRLMGLPYPVGAPAVLLDWLEAKRGTPGFRAATVDEPDLPGRG